MLFTLIAERYERRSLGITSNLVFSEWEKIFANPMATAAAIDRIVHHSVIMEFDLPSYRTSEAQERQLHRTMSGQGSWRKAARIIIVDHSSMRRQARERYRHITRGLVRAARCPQGRDTLPRLPGQGEPARCPVGPLRLRQDVHRAPLLRAGAGRLRCDKELLALPA